jgi:ABC-2 type transport system permease protein
MTHAATASPTAGLSRLAFGGIVRSEWIKLRSLRSTVWCYIIILLAQVGLGLLLAADMARSPGRGHDAQQAIIVLVITSGVLFGQLVASVLGALVITGEYGTGMIRSTFTAVPTRLPALLAKGLVFGVVTFVVGLVAILLTLLASAGILTSHGYDIDLGDGHLWLAVLGAAGYLALIGLIAFALGAIVRNSAGGIAASLGLLLVLPIILSIFTGGSMPEWVQNLGVFLPGSAGGHMYDYVAGPVRAAAGTIVLLPWQGLLVLLAWVVGLSAIAAVLVRRRDA